MSVSVGIPAHNEANNIGQLLKALSTRRIGDGFSINEIIVVASGCTDGTEEIVERHMKSDPRIKLIVEKERRGKASAINILLNKCDSDVLIMEPADTIPQKNSLHSLLLPFNDQTIGATSGRQVPINPDHSIMGWIPHVVWNLYHCVSESEDSQGTYFRLCGEFCAIRTGIVNRIPETIVNDDAYIGLQIKRAGYKVAYVSEATVIGKGPSNIQDFVTQRRRIIFGHLQLEKTNNARITTIRPSQILRMLPKTIGVHPKRFIGTLAGIGLEAFSHFLARRDLSQGKSYKKWRMVASTKSLITR